MWTRALLDRVTIGVFAIVTALPVGLYALGVTTDPAPTEVTVATPDLRALVRLEPDALEQLQAAIERSNPVRTPAVRINAWTDLRAFGDSPSADVLLGSEGWLFYSNAATQACRDDEAVDRILAHARLTLDVVDASGREGWLAIAPDKVAVVTQRHGDAGPFMRCPHQNASRLAAAIASRPTDGVVNTFAHLLALPDAEAAYLRLDTHWNARGSAEWLESVLTAVSPTSEMRIRPAGAGTKPGDLARLSGLPDRETVPLVDIDLAAGRPVPGTTYFLHDSFGLTTAPQLAEVVEQLRTHRVDWAPELITMPSDLGDSDRVLIEMVQRRALPLLERRQVAPALVAALLQDLDTTTSHDPPGHDPAVDFVVVRADVADGTQVALIDVAGDRIHDGVITDGEVVFEVGGRHVMGVVTDVGDPVIVSTWTAVRLPRAD